MFGYFTQYYNYHYYSNCNYYVNSQIIQAIMPSQAETGSDSFEGEGHSFYAPLLNETKISFLCYKQPIYCFV